MNEQRFDTDASLRAGDAEREQVADRLRRSHAEGRLDVEELQDRLERCYAAKTVGELRGLVVDLPGEHPVRERASGRPSLRRLPLFPIVPLLLTILVISAISHGHVLLVLLPLFFLARILVWRHGGRILGWRRAAGAWRA